MKGRPPVADGRRVFDLFPRGARPWGTWLYAVALPDGRTKLGIASRPRSRIQMYWRAHEGVHWAHLFPRTDKESAIRIERRALEMAASCSERIGRTEYFRNLPKSSALACVRAAYEVAA